MTLREERRDSEIGRCCFAGEFGSSSIAAVNRKGTVVGNWPESGSKQLLKRIE